MSYLNKNMKYIKFLKYSKFYINTNLNYLMTYLNKNLKYIKYIKYLKFEINTNSKIFNIE